MMKCLYFLMFVATSQAYVSRERSDPDSQAYESRERGNLDLPAPRLLRMTLEGDPSLALKVEWSKVETPEGVDPVQGYKVKVWEQNQVKTYRYETVNGVQKLVEDYKTEKFPDHQVPTHKPRDIIVNGPEKTSATVDGIEQGVAYQVRVQAYNKNGDGPLSQSMGVQVAPKEENYNNSDKDMYTVA